MLGYLDNLPLYNAANFSLALVNSSVFAGSQSELDRNRRGQRHGPAHESIEIHVPLRPQRRQQNNNSYHGSYGATTTGLYNWTAPLNGNTYGGGPMVEVPTGSRAFSRSARATASSMLPTALPTRSLSPRHW